MIGADDAWKGVKWAWANRKEIAAALSSFRRWWKKSRILVIGPAGTGKTTLVRLLCGEFDWLTDSPWRFDEDVAVTRHRLRGSAPAEVIVLPGQDHRRQSRGPASVVT